VALFIGSPTMNVLGGRIEEGGCIVLAGRPLPLTCQMGRGEQVSIGIRPEAVRISPGDYGKTLLNARIRRIEHHGSERLVYLDLEAPLQGTLIARVPGGEGSEDGRILEPRRSVGLHLDPARLHVFDAAGQRVAATPTPIALDTAPLSDLTLARAIAS
jgi:ABC-type sugar transport system ATPase subunit